MRSDPHRRGSDAGTLASIEPRCLAAVCLILFAYRVVPRHPLVLAANRDEFHDRPALAAHWWEDAPSIYGGRDRRAGGTWLAVSRRGRLAAVTNWTDANGPASAAESRGNLPRAFLVGRASPQAFAENINGRAYAGFNFLAYDGGALVYASNRMEKARVLPPGVYGLTNTRLGEAVSPDAPVRLDSDAWPKATLGAQALCRIAGQATVDDLLALLARPLLPASAPTSNGRSGATSSKPERRQSPAFIRGAEYGTRASTAVIFEREKVFFAERQYGPLGTPGRRSATTIAISHPANRKETA